MRARRGRQLAVTTLLSGVVALCTAGGAHAAKQCTEPVGGDWQEATPAQAGMDAAKLQDALDYGTSELGLSLRVYRNGCRVGVDRAYAANKNQKFESWSLGKSISSILFGRAMTQGAISPDDPVGALLPEADAAHGASTMRDVLTMSTGVRWNGLRDYNIFTNKDRVRDWLTLAVDHEPGTFYEYAQSAVAIVPKAVERATGSDPRDYLQKGIMTPLGIEPASWDWQRDNQRNIEGFWGARMTTDDFARLGELLRRDGVWRGERLLSQEYLAGALAPATTNPCYGWLIWLNNAKPCIAPRITDRTVADEYGYPGTPRDGFVFSGLFGQIVAVFPSQGIVIARNGQESNANLAGGSGYQIELFQRVLKSIVDEPVELPDDGPGSPLESTDEGFQNAIFDPGEYSKGAFPDPLPPAGPARARAAILRGGGKGIRGRRAFVRLDCPTAIEGAVQGCAGALRAKGAQRRSYEVAAGESRRLGLRLRRKTVKRLIRKGELELTIRARNGDEAAGAESVATLPYRDAAKGKRKGF